MNPSKTGKNYDSISDRWSDDRFDMKNGIDQHKRALIFAESRGRALDVGCGPTGRIMGLLQKEGFTPEGLDVSEKMITLARNRNPEWKFYHEDICSYQPREKYDFITAWDSVWHIPLVMIFSFGGLDEPGDHTDDTMGPMMYYSSLGTNGFMQVLLDNGCAIKHLEFDQYPELHAYMVVQKIA